MYLIKDLMLFGILFPILLIVAPIIDIVFYVTLGIFSGVINAFLSTTKSYFGIFEAYKDRWGL